VVELDRLRDIRQLFTVEPGPEGGHDRVGNLSPAGFAGDLAAGESKPLPAAVIAFEVSPRVQRDEDPAARQGSGKLRRPLGTNLVFPVHKPGLFGPGIGHL
jgi:hypothetical protein